MPVLATRLPRRAPRAALPAALLALAAACSDPADPEAAALRDADNAIAGQSATCEGPARDLPAHLAAGLAPAGGGRTMDDAWAELSRTVPGGFAGVMYDAPPADAAPRTTGRPILMLVDPARAAEAKAALAAHIPGFDVAGADVRRVRWSFAQLYDWYRYLNTIAWQERGMSTSDVDEAANRIAYGLVDEAARDRLAGRLAALDLPCDLVVLRIVPQARPLARTVTAAGQR